MALDVTERNGGRVPFRLGVSGRVPVRFGGAVQATRGRLRRVVPRQSRQGLDWLAMVRCGGQGVTWWRMACRGRAVGAGSPLVRRGADGLVQAVTVCLGELS